MPGCGSTTAARSARIFRWWTRWGTKPAASCTVSAPCIHGTSVAASGCHAAAHADGRTMLRASYGRFNQGVLTGELARSIPARPRPRRPTFDPATGGYTNSIFGGRSEEEPAVRSSDAHAAHRRVLRSASIVKWAWASRSRSPTFTRTAATSSAGRISAVSIARNAKRSGRPQRAPVRAPQLHGGSALPVDESTGYSMTYDGLVMAVEKRQAHGWQALARIRYSKSLRAAGVQRRNAAGSQVSTIAAAVLTFGQDPNNLTNASGRLPTIARTC